MNATEIIVSLVLGILSAAIYTYAVYRKGYEVGFERATEPSDELHQIYVQTRKAKR